MEEKKIDYAKVDIREIELNNIETIGFVNKDKLQSAISKLSQVKKLVEEMLEVKEQIPNLPPLLLDKISRFENKIREFIIGLIIPQPGSSQELVRKKEELLNNIEKYYIQTFNAEYYSSEKIYLLECYSFLKAISNSTASEKYTFVLEKFRSEYKELTSDIINQKDTLLKNSAESETILNELKKKVSTQTVSDYAKVFEGESSNYHNLAKYWMIAGISISILFIVGLIILNQHNLLPTELVDDDNNFIRYNLNNIVSRLIIISLFIFLIGFSFKQFSVNKHHEALNKHRQNALNSYKLFTQSIIGEDENSRNALMIQVAKAIYENSQSTGYISDKGQNINPGIIELTKIIGSNKP